MSGQRYCRVSGKVCFDKRTEAERALREMQRKPTRKCVGAGIYPCPLGCGAFHITHQFKSYQHRMKADALRKAEGRA